ncbi:DUF1993 domain-containing protein [Novosphingobium flavum]|uniref:DUF1993 domain-containing protein n=1 Tax=Novosphingobium flavum TaxID=1778672 RepID=A0A7X1KLI4_9SPHN|nr:DUF1993 domain-containing protein [Novosphingobium flavum]MBC2665338.1 DUF1993 domain-containing protein [Novosphingobium flavum]
MGFNIYEASAPVFIHSLRNMSAWLDKASAEKAESDLIDARLAPDMRPLSSQFQMASDTAKNAIGRLCGIDAPAMPDTEASFAELKERCARTIAFIESVQPGAFENAETRAVELKFPNGMGYQFTGSAYLTGFALPNFFFHVTTAYAILRANGVTVGKPDFLQHLGMPKSL